MLGFNKKWRAAHSQGSLEDYLVLLKNSLEKEADNINIQEYISEFSQSSIDIFKSIRPGIKALFASNTKFPKEISAAL